MNLRLLRLADEALERIAPMEAVGWAPAAIIARQLRWCLALATDSPREASPGSFSMSLIAVRELDMHGGQPELATLIAEVQREAERELSKSASRGVC